VTEVIVLDILASTETWLGPSRLCGPSRAPQLDAARALKALGVPDSVAVHFRRFGQLVRAVTLGKLLEPTLTLADA
jgi:hypothetical protein